MLLNTKLPKWAVLPTGMHFFRKKKSLGMAARKNGAREEARNVWMSPNYGKNTTSGLLSVKKDKLSSAYYAGKGIKRIQET